MNLKNNKGYVAIDASIAVLVLLIIVPTIAGMIYNVNKTNNYIDRKTEAISIAINTIEVAKGIDITELTEEKWISDLKEIYEEIDKTELTLTIKDNTYKIEIDIEDYNDINELAEAGKVKTITVIVTFKSGNQNQNIELSTVINC